MYKLIYISIVERIDQLNGCILIDRIGADKEAFDLFIHERGLEGLGVVVVTDGAV